MDRKLYWLHATLLLIPLVFINYYILHLHLDEDTSIGCVGVLIFFSFNQFFFQRRNRIYTIKTICWFYIFGILSSLFISYGCFYLTSGLMPFLLLMQVCFFGVIIDQTSILTNQGEDDFLAIEKEIENKKWYQKILASKTQRKKNREYILDSFCFAFFIIALFLLKYILIDS